jgi:hypothetical protein
MAQMSPLVSSELLRHPSDPRPFSSRSGDLPTARETLNIHHIFIFGPAKSTQASKMEFPSLGSEFNVGVNAVRIARTWL